MLKIEIPKKELSLEEKVKLLESDMVATQAYLVLELATAKANIAALKTKVGVKP